MSTYSLPHLAVQRPCLWTQEFNNHPWLNSLVANQRTLCTLFRVVDASSFRLGTPPVIYMYANDAATIFREWKTTLVLYRSQSTPGHSLSDITVRGLRKCSGASFRRKQWEMEIILRLGTLQPEGLKNVFHFQLTAPSSSLSALSFRTLLFKWTVLRTEHWFHIEEGLHQKRLWFSSHMMTLT